MTTKEGPGLQGPYSKNPKGCHLESLDRVPDAQTDTHTNTGWQTHTHSWKFPQQVLVAPLVEN